MKIERNKDCGDSKFICEFWGRLHREWAVEGGLNGREKQVFQEVRVYAKVWRYRSPWHVMGTLSNSTWLGNQKSQMAQDRPIFSVLPENLLICPQPQKCPRLDD